MCGIIGYIGKRKALPVLINGLKKLEYRGYDSAGVAFTRDGSLRIKRSVGKLINLEASASDEDSGNIGIGHTRWATHGKPSEENAHPHRAGKIVLVHNGIIENYLDLKNRLIAKGHEFKSETDTEVIAHLIEECIKGGNRFEPAVQKALSQVRGAYALCIMHEDEPDKLIAAKNGCPIALGLGDGESFVASDIPAILEYTRKVIFMDDLEMAIITSQGIEIKDLTGTPKKKEPIDISWNPVMAEKGGYKHFMHKEIHEQPMAIMNTMMGRISLDSGMVSLDDLELSDSGIKGLDKIYIVACGTSWHAALIGKYMIEDIARIPVEVDLGSEFRYRDPIIGKDDLLIAISQSGETADTLAAIREARSKDAKVISICNVVGSSSARESDGVLYTHAGPEIGVASTKAFTSQLAALFLLTLYIGQAKGTLSEARGMELVSDFVRIPALIEEILRSDSEILKVARKYFRCRDFIYLGRGINYPVALEGALKLKEVSYIHAEGYPAGEMKHGPIALIDENMPVVVLAPMDKVYEKVMNNVMEVKAREGMIIAIVNNGDHKISSKADDLIFIPKTDQILTPILSTIPLQMLAYHIAVLRGTDVDQPRNLAKSVTVE
ncbi:MAG: glutamine--fructose-6-phosphate transaminase (isomerizing) [Nitrospirae bacterium]|nr:glutamine--fructose-6-phosphate transaminase (isomerizing) [Nitrospirota bacterium]